jgi:phenylalanyl-tRNA synthetase alpha chain
LERAMTDPIEDLRQEFEQELQSALALETSADNPDSALERLTNLRNTWLGREKGRVTMAMKLLREMPKEERPAFGQAMNQLREDVEKRLTGALEELRRQAKLADIARSRIDVTRPGFPFAVGFRHPIKQLQAEIEQTFVSMGFKVFDLPEIEDEYHNFEALNMPRHHPARDSQDTFYLDESKLLRTHCSTVQVHAMKSMKPPIRAVTTGKCYRRDPADATHSPMFYQLDVLAVDRGITMGDLKGTLEIFLRKIFHPDIRMRLRPGFFPFVEPGAEVDISCIFCDGKGCRICKQSGWIEILGAGMVHPKVLRMSGVDEERYSGFAWGMGIDRVAIIKYGVDDIRLFFENDLRFLAQF